MALQKRLQIDPNNLELAINEILASHADPKYTAWKLVIMDHTGWQLNPTDTGYLDVQCTGLGGGELDKDWEVLLACRREAHVYGPSLSKQDDWKEKRLAPSQAQHTPRNTSYFILPCSRLASTLGATSLECLLPISYKLKSSTVQGKC